MNHRTLAACLLPPLVLALVAGPVGCSDGEPDDTSAARCRADAFVSMAVDVEAPSSDPASMDATVQRTVGSFVPEVEWELVDATAERRSWAGTVDGELVVLADVDRGSDGWAPGGVRDCAGVLSSGADG